jgi:hypothetical protein
MWRDRDRPPYREFHLPDAQRIAWNGGRARALGHDRSVRPIINRPHPGDQHEVHSFAQD